MRFVNVQIVSAGNMGSDVLSTGIYMEQYSDASIQAVWTGTPAGNLTIQVSNDEGVPYDASTVVNWTTYPNSTQAAGGAAGSYFWNIPDLAARWIRLHYDASSSTGTLNAMFNAKADS